MIDPAPHHPAFPEDRQFFARLAMLAGTALHLPDEVAERAERDAAYLERRHKGRDRALWRTRPATT